MRHLNHIYQNAALMAKLPGEVLPGQLLIEIVGDRRLLIENHCGVCGYDSCQVQVKINQGCVVIHGENLELMQMTRQQLVITGLIKGVEFWRGGVSIERR